MLANDFGRIFKLVLCDYNVANKEVIDNGQKLQLDGTFLLELNKKSTITLNEEDVVNVKPVNKTKLLAFAGYEKVASSKKEKLEKSKRHKLHKIKKGVEDMYTMKYGLRKEETHISLIEQSDIKTYVCEEDSYEGHWIKTVLFAAHYIYYKMIQIESSGLNNPAIRNIPPYFFNSPIIALRIYCAQIPKCDSDKDVFVIGPMERENVFTHNGKNIKFEYMETIKVVLKAPSKICYFTNRGVLYNGSPNQISEAEVEATNVESLSKYNAITTKKIYNKNPDYPLATFLSIYPNEERFKIYNFVEFEEKQEQPQCAFEPRLIAHNTDTRKQQISLLSRIGKHKVEDVVDINTQGELCGAIISSVGVRGTIIKDNCLVNNVFDIIKYMLPPTNRALQIRQGNTFSCDTIVGDSQLGGESLDRNMTKEAATMSKYIAAFSRNRYENATQIAFRNIMETVLSEINMLQFCANYRSKGSEDKGSKRSEDKGYDAMEEISSMVMNNYHKLDKAAYRKRELSKDAQLSKIVNYTIEIITGITNYSRIYQVFSQQTREAAINQIIESIENKIEDDNIIKDDSYKENGRQKHRQSKRVMSKDKQKHKSPEYYSSSQSDQQSDYTEYSTPLFASTEQTTTRKRLPTYDHRQNKIKEWVEGVHKLYGDEDFSSDSSQEDIESDRSKPFYRPNQQTILKSVPLKPTSVYRSPEPLSSFRRNNSDRSRGFHMYAAVAPNAHIGDTGYCGSSYGKSQSKATKATKHKYK